MATAPITDPRARAGRVAAIVVNYRTSDLTLACVEAIAAERGALPGLTLVVVDGGSDDGSAETLAAELAARGHGGWATLLPLPINGGFGYANNQALLHLAAQPDPPAYACLINPDAIVRPGALERLFAALDANPAAGAIGALLEDEAGHCQGSAFTFPSIRSEFSRGAQTDVIRRLLRVPPVARTCDAACRVDWVTGAAVAFRMAALGQSGLFDDGFFLYFEEVELMHRLSRAGWEIWHEPAARVLHAGGASTGVRWDEDVHVRPGPLPLYWYRSRRRYFVRTLGPAGATLAGLAFLAGRLLWRGRRTLQRRPDPFPLRTTQDTARHSLWPSTADRAATPLPQLGDAPGRHPRWMR